MRTADNEFNLVIGSNQPGHEFIIYDSLLPDFDVKHAAKASLVVDGNQVTARDNQIESSVNEIFIHLINDSPANEKIKLKVGPDIEGVEKSLAIFVEIYNNLLQFFHQ